MFLKSNLIIFFMCKPFGYFKVDKPCIIHVSSYKGVNLQADIIVSTLALHSLKMQ